MINLNLITLQYRPSDKLVKKPAYTNVMKPALTADAFCKQNCSSAISFKGFTQDLSNNLYSTRDQVLQLFSHYKDKSNGVVGNLPQSWLGKIPQENKKALIKEVYSEMSKATAILKDNKTNTERASQIISSVLQKAKVLSKDDRAHIEFISSGAYGSGILLELPVDNKIERYVLKLGTDGAFLDSFAHGIDIEINRAAFWNKHAPKNANRAQFYYGDIKSGYMLVKCVDETMPAPKTTSVEQFGLSEDDDTSYNMIYDYFIEYGGLITKTLATRTKASLQVYKQMFNTPAGERVDKWYQIYNNKQLPDRKNVELGLAASIELLKDSVDYTCLTKLYDLILKNKDNHLAKVSLIKQNILHNHPNYFDVIKQNSDIEVKINLLEKIGYLDLDQRQAFIAYCFNEVLSDKSTDAFKDVPVAKRPFVVDKYDLLSATLAASNSFGDEKLSAVFNQLIKMNDDKVDARLVKHINMFRDKQLTRDYYKKLKQNPSVIVQKELINQLFQIRRLDSDLAQSYYRDFAKNPAEELKVPLIKRASVLPENEMMDSLRKLTINANDEVIKAVIENAIHMPREGKFKFIKDELCNIKELDITTKIELVRASINFTKEDRYELLDIYSKDIATVDPALKLALFMTYNTFITDKAEYKEFFNKFAQGADQKFRSFILSNSKCPHELLPQFIRDSALGLEGKDNVLIAAIIKNFNALPENEIVDYFKHFKEMKEPVINSLLIPEIRRFEEPVKIAYFNQFLQKTTDYEKPALIKALVHLPNAMAKERFYDFATGFEKLDQKQQQALIDVSRILGPDEKNAWIEDMLKLDISDLARSKLTQTISGSRASYIDW